MFDIHEAMVQIVADWVLRISVAVLLVIGVYFLWHCDGAAILYFFGLVP